MSFRHSRPRRLAAVGLLVATGLFLTACGGGDSSSAKDGSSESSASSEEESESREASADPGEESDAGADGGTVGGGDGGADGAREESGQQGASESKDGATDGGREGAVQGGADGGQEGTAGTFNGVLSYLAPGKLMVGDRAFLISEDTVATGYGICGDPEKGAQAPPCTVEELEKAAKDGRLTIEVSIDKNGIADRIMET